MGYARMAPLKRITEHVLELQTTITLKDVITDLRTSLSDLNKKHDDLKQHVIDELREELKDQESVMAETVEDEEFVVNTRAEVHHRVRLRAGDSWLWSTRCSWTFGRTGHCFTATLATKPDELCDKCFYRERKVLESCT